MSTDPVKKQHRGPALFGRWQRSLRTTGLVLLLGTTAALRGGDWPHWRGPDFNGISSETDYLAQWPTGGPKVLWKTPVGVGYSSMSVSAGRLYTMGNTDDVDAVSCLEAASGKVLWRHTYPSIAKDPNGYHGTRVTPTVDGGLVYSLGRHGHFFALDAKTGKVAWSKDFKKDYGAKDPRWGFSGSPLVEGRLVITEVGGKGTSVVAFDKLTGREVWRAGSDKVGYSSIVPFEHAGQRSLAVFSAETITGRDPATGQERWHAAWKTRYDVNAATPIVTDGRVFVSSGYGRGCALIDFSGRKPKTLWENKNMRNHVGTCVLSDGHIYGFDERELRCLDLATGKVLWKERKYGKGSLFKAGQHWIIYSEKGYVAVADLDATGCRELSGFQVLKGKATWAVPVLANGLLFCRNLDTVVGVDLRP